VGVLGGQRVAASLGAPATAGAARALAARAGERVEH
jgi:hypothetical protein